MQIVSSKIVDDPQSIFLHVKWADYRFSWHNVNYDTIRWDWNCCIEASYIYWYIKMSIILFETRAFKTYFSFCSSITNVYFHYEEDNKKKKGIRWWRRKESLIPLKKWNINYKLVYNNKMFFCLWIENRSQFSLLKKI